MDQGAARAGWLTYRCRIVEPHLRFEGQSGKQATMFLLDPSGNAIEFKAFHDVAGQLFA